MTGDASLHPGTAPPDQFAVAEDFAGLARQLHAGFDIASTLGLICSLAVARVPNCRHAAVSTLQRNGIETCGATDDLPAAVDRIQHETGQGPCVDALRTAEIVGALDLATDARWPRFSARALSETGVRATVSFPLQAGDRTLGALTFYSRVPGAFMGDGVAIRWGRVYSAHAALALTGAHARADLLQALDSRETISVAVGILMGRQQISRSQAFDILRRASQRTNRKLREVAADIAGRGPTVTPSAIDELLELTGTGSHDTPG